MQKKEITKSKWAKAVFSCYPFKAAISVFEGGFQNTVLFLYATLI
jgi:hypothetical protein